MKKRSNLIQKLIGITAISAILILSIGILPPPTEDNYEIKKGPDLVETYDDPTEYFESIDLIDSELSIIDTEIILTETNDSLINRFLDSQEINSPLTEKFGVETQIALFDSNNEVYNFSDVFGIAQLSVTDDEGRLLDLGSIQATFESISKQEEKSTNVWGKVEFYLDDDKVASKYLWGSERNSDRLKLSLADNLVIVDNLPVPPTFSEQEKTNFTFTLSDEGRDWEDQSNHTYRVVITELNASLKSENDYKEFRWIGQHIAYELNVTVNEKKKVAYDYMGEAIEIFKSDNTLQLCGIATIQEIPYVGWVRHNASPPPVQIIDESGNVIVDTEFTAKDAKNTRFGGKHAFGQIWTNESCSPAGELNFPRNAVLTFIVGDKSMQVNTPKTQENFYIKATFSDSPQAKCVRYECSQQYPATNIVTNFGFETGSYDGIE